MNIKDAFDAGILSKQLANEIHVWSCFPEQITDPVLLDSYRVLLSKEETEHYQRFIFDDDRHNYLISHALVRVVLSKYSDIEPSAWQFESNAHGRPEIKQGHSALPLRFNLTHTKGLCACIVTSGALCGIDAEHTHRKNNLMQIAQRMYSPGELAQLQQHEGAALSEYFFKYWTLREAYVKALGTGLSGSSKDFEFQISGNNQVSIRFNGALKGSSETSEQWKFVLFESTQEHITAIAVFDEDKELSVVSHIIVP